MSEKQYKQAVDMINDIIMKMKVQSVYIPCNIANIYADWLEQALITITQENAEIKKKVEYYEGSNRSIADEMDRVNEQNKELKKQIAELNSGRIPLCMKCKRHKVSHEPWCIYEENETMTYGKVDDENNTCTDFKEVDKP